MATLENVTEWRGREMFDRDGEKIGTIDSVYLDQLTGRAEWALVHTGLFGMRSTWVPIADAVPEPHGVRVPVEKAAVKRAPSMDPDSDMSREEEAKLFRYYGRDYDEAAVGGSPGEAHGGTGQRDRDPDPSEHRREPEAPRREDPASLSEPPRHEPARDPAAHQAPPVHPGTREQPAAQADPLTPDGAGGDHAERAPEHRAPDLETHRSAGEGRHAWPLAHEDASPAEPARSTGQAGEVGHDEPRGLSAGAQTRPEGSQPDHHRNEATSALERHSPEPSEGHREDQAPHQEERSGHRGTEFPGADREEPVRTERRESHEPQERVEDPELRSTEDRRDRPEHGGSGRHPGVERAVDRVATRLKRMI